MIINYKKGEATITKNGVSFKTKDYKTYTLNGKEYTQEQMLKFFEKIA